MPTSEQNWSSHADRAEGIGAGVVFTSPGVVSVTKVVGTEGSRGSVGPTALLVMLFLVLWGQDLVVFETSSIMVPWGGTHCFLHQQGYAHFKMKDMRSDLP